MYVSGVSVRNVVCERQCGGCGSIEHRLRVHLQVSVCVCVCVCACMGCSSVCERSMTGASCLFGSTPIQRQNANLDDFWFVCQEGEERWLLVGLGLTGDFPGKTPDRDQTGSLSENTTPFKIEEPIPTLAICFSCGCLRACAV